MLENDIAEAGGEAVILQTVALDPAQEAKVLTRFKAERDEAYAEFIDKCDDFEREVAKEVTASHYTYAELEENDVDLKKLQGWLAKIRKLDFYNADRAAEAEQRLAGCVAVLDDYARRVFDAHDENK
jgi:hypothetical protein